jgi:formate dehydrogenase iron-sulfur subunit
MAIGEGVASPNQARHRHVREGREVGFFTDPTVCIGCKACEVACKEWNQVPDDGFEWTGNSYDNTGALGASSWRHVKFVEQDRPGGGAVTGLEVEGERVDDRDMAAAEPEPGEALVTVDPEDGQAFRWLFVSDVCKHCENAGCLEACPTGAIVRGENGAVFVQDDVCNGCGYCVTGCPFGVIDRRPEPLPGSGGAFKCTFCYDRQAHGYTPACAKACPTESIQFGPLDELRERAAIRVEELQDRGYDDARLYDPTDTSVEGTHAFFPLLGDPEDYGFPPEPQVPTRHLRAGWTSAFLTSFAAMAGAMLAFALV